MLFMLNALPIESRDHEALRLQRCIAAARSPQSATIGDEALLFQLAAQLISSRSAISAVNLARAAEGFEMPASVAHEALRRGLIVSLPRFRERLLQQIGFSS